MSRNFLRRVIVDGPKQITGGRNGELRIAFSCKMWHSGTPNECHIEIYNPGPATLAAYNNETVVGQNVTLSAGYEDNVGPIFMGQIKQTIFRHVENAVDTVLDIFAADNDTGYRKTRVSATLRVGYTPKDKMQVALDAMSKFGVTLGVNALDLSQPVYPRGTPLIGMARQVLREVTLSAGGLWSVQMGKLMLTKKDLDTGSSSTVKLTAATGLVGYPAQTQDGIFFRSLINPKLQPLMKVTLDPSQIIAAEQNNNTFTGGPGNSGNVDLKSQNITAGTYTIYKIDRVGDTRGQDYYDECMCIGQGGILPASVKGQLYSINSQ